MSLVRLRESGKSRVPTWILPQIMFSIVVDHLAKTRLDALLRECRTSIYSRTSLPMPALSDIARACSFT